MLGGRNLPNRLYIHKSKNIWQINGKLVDHNVILQGGMYVFQLMDAYACSGPCMVFVVFWSSVSMGWCYGAERWLLCIKTMIGYHPGHWWAICWKYIVPLITLVSFCWLLLQMYTRRYGCLQLSTYH